jgi:SnoaL-like protein
VVAVGRLAIRELFDAYAHCADRRDAKGQKALFTDDTRFAGRASRVVVADRADRGANRDEGRS